MLSPLKFSPIRTLSRTAHSRIPFRHRISTHLPPPPCSNQSACACELPPSPDLAPGLSIDTTSPLSNTTPAYHTHLLLATGKSDWNSKIAFEPDPNGRIIGSLQAAIKQEEARLLAAGDEEAAQRRVLVSMSSFPAPAMEKPMARLHFQPHGVQVDFQHLVSENYAKIAEMAMAPRESMLEIPNIKEHIVSSAPTGMITILLCTHGQRDMRCGILGPYLRDCIKTIIRDRPGIKDNFVVVDNPSSLAEYHSRLPDKASMGKIPVAVECVSHIGGHKWAGNMIVYFPQREGKSKQAADLSDGEQASGKLVRGVWYGRVNRDNVERIFVRTLVGFKDGRGDVAVVGGEECRRIVY